MDSEKKLTDQEQKDIRYIREGDLGIYNFLEIPKERRTPPVCYNAVVADPQCVLYLDQEELSPPILKEALKDNYIYLEKIPKEVMNDELYHYALDLHGMALKYFPDNLKTESNCMIAVKQNPGALFYIPEQLRTREICIQALETATYTLEKSPYLNLLSEIPHSDIAARAYNEYYWYKGGDENPIELFQMIRPGVVNQEVIDEGLKMTGELFEYLPNEFKTVDNAVKAVSLDGINTIPLTFINEKTLDAHLRNEEHSFKDIERLANEGNLSAKHLLFIEKILERVPPDDYPHLNGEHLPIPEKILNEDNQYSFNKMLKDHNIFLNYNDIMALYAGKKVEVSFGRLSPLEPGENYIQYDRKTGDLTVTKTDYRVSMLPPVVEKKPNTTIVNLKEKPAQKQNARFPTFPTKKVKSIKHKH